MNKTVKRFRTGLVLGCTAMLLGSAAGYAQGTGTITGKVTDRADGSALWGANVLVLGTSIGATTDDVGRFSILQVSSGKVTVVARYLGYETGQREVTVVANQVVEVEFALKSSVIPQDEVVVTAQLRGQQAAINQQLSSNAILNVLSQETIRELPDQNAAEAISRLPGVTVERTGGEAQKVIIRGLSPKYSNITVNGEKIPSTDVADRSVDLSPISPDMLVGIEVYKSPTADKDGDAVGGTINFAMKKASPEPSADARLEGGYNALENSYSDYRGTLNIGNRYLDNAVGIVLTGNFQKTNRGSDGQQEVYSLSTEPTPGAPIPYQIDDMRLVDRREIRQRYGASAAIDYDLGMNSSIFLTGFWGQTNRDEARRRQRFNIQESRLEYDYVDHTIKTQLFSASLAGDHAAGLPLLGDTYLNWRAAASVSDQNNPFELYGRFFRMGLSGVVANQGPENVPSSVTLTPDNTWLKQMSYTNERVTDRTYTFQFDARRDFSAGATVSGYLKLGGKVSLKSRDRNRTQILSNTVLENSLGQAIYNDPSAFYRSFPLTADVNPKILMSGFQSSTDEIGKFLGGRYATWPSLGGAALHDFWNNMRYWVNSSGTPLFDNTQTGNDDRLAANNSYSAGEKIFAGYVMTEVRLGNDIMVLPGIRYERTRNDYQTIASKTAALTEETPSIVTGGDTTGRGSHENWLPMIQTRVTLMEGLTLRASAARTLARPNFWDLVPYEMVDRIGSPQTIQKGNPSLEYVTAMNYDLYFSLFNRYGLFTVGGFYKRLDNVSYVRTSYVRSGPFTGFRLIQPVNAADPSEVYGGELELQANLTLLPEPFDGIIIAGNISLMKSRTLYPRFLVNNIVIPTPPFVIVSVVDTVREAPMPGQANVMGNLTIGYQRGGFSGRVSLIYQGKSLAVVGTRAEEDGYTDAYYRWDMVLQQKLFAGTSLFLNVNNITQVRDKSSNMQYVTFEQFYGWSTQLGIRFKL